MRYVHERMHVIGQLAFRALDAKIASGELYLDTLRNNYRIFCNSRHIPVLRNARAERATAPVIHNPLSPRGRGVRGEGVAPVHPALATFAHPCAADLVR